MINRPEGGMINRPIDQSTNRSIDGSVNRWISQSMDQSIDGSVNRSIDHSIAQPTNPTTRPGEGAETCGGPLVRASPLERSGSEPHATERKRDASDHARKLCTFSPLTWWGCRRGWVRLGERWGQRQRQRERGGERDGVRARKKKRHRQRLRGAHLENGRARADPSLVRGRARKHRAHRVVPRVDRHPERGGQERGRRRQRRRLRARAG